MLCEKWRKNTVQSIINEDNYDKDDAADEHDKNDWNCRIRRNYDFLLRTHYLPCIK